MKKVLMAAAVVTLVSVVSLQNANANWGGRGQGYNNGCNNGTAMMARHHGGGGAMAYNQRCANMQSEAFDAFRKDTTALRRTMMSKRVAMRALMNGTNPDPDQAAKLAGELFDLREQMRSKAKERNLNLPAGGCGMGMMGMRGQRG
jgi:Spy/CpxP family protein refolding chaperone